MIKIWKKYLITTFKLFLKISKNTNYFKLKIIIFFISINILFYWIAMITAFPELIFGSSSLEYFLLQFPVGILGGFFDSLSLIITVYIIKRAITSNTSFLYLAHLSIDLFIACVATMWVLFVFIISGWLISFLVLNPENLLLRKGIYEERVISAINNPTGKNELKNIFFGLIMGLSAMLPTLLHLYLFLKSIKTFLKIKVN